MGNEAKVRAQVETITPDIAAKYLACNSINRPIKKPVVLHYAEQMKKGQWLLNGEPICFSEAGRLENGQHRLNAIIKAGVPVDILVVRGVDEKSFNVYDSGVNRTNADVFSLNGIPNYTSVSSIVNRYSIICRARKFIGTAGQKLPSGKHQSKMSKIDLLDEYKSSPELYQSIHLLSSSCVSKLALFSATEIGGFLVFLVKKKRHDMITVERFARALFFNEDCENATIILLRDKIVKDRMNGRSTMTGEYKQALLIKTWNAYITRKELKVLNYSKEREGIIPIL